MYCRCFLQRFVASLLALTLLLALGCSTISRIPQADSSNTSTVTLAPSNTSAPTLASAPAQRVVIARDTATVTTLKANLRHGPTKSEAVVTELKRGDALTLVSIEPVNSWYRVRHDATATEGWVYAGTIRIGYPQVEPVASLPPVPPAPAAPVADYPTTAPVAQPVAPRRVAEPEIEEDEETVYVTRTGKKYHSAGCQYLSRSQIPMSLSDARMSYDPCSRCNPPE